MTTGIPNDATGIYNSLLAKIEASYAAADFSAFRNCIALPHWILTPARIRSIRCEGALRTLFDRFTSYLSTNRVIDMVRLSEPCWHARPDRIRGAHVTHLINVSGQRIRDPYRVVSLLTRTDGRWQVRASLNALAEREWPTLAFASKQRGTP